MITRRRRVPAIPIWKLKELLEKVPNDLLFCPTDPDGDFCITTVDEEQIYGVIYCEKETFSPNGAYRA